MAAVYLFGCLHAGPREYTLDIQLLHLLRFAAASILRSVQILLSPNSPIVIQEDLQRERVCYNALVDEGSRR